MYPHLSFSFSHKLCMPLIQRVNGVRRISMRMNQVRMKHRYFMSWKEHSFVFSRSPHLRGQCRVTSAMKTMTSRRLRWAWCWCCSRCAMPMNRTGSWFMFLVEPQRKGSLTRTPFWFPLGVITFFIFLYRFTSFLKIQRFQERWKSYLCPKHRNIKLQRTEVSTQAGANFVAIYQSDIRNKINSCLTCFLFSLASGVSPGLRCGEFFLTNCSTLPGGKCRGGSPTWPTGMSYGSTIIVPSGKIECRSCCCRKCSAARCCLQVLKRTSCGSNTYR